jgi:hypothetical protein
LFGRRGELAEQFAERLVVAAVCGARGLDVALGLETLPVDPVPGAECELADERALRPPVAFAERVGGVDLREVVSEPFDEPRADLPAEEVSDLR